MSIPKRTTTTELSVPSLPGKLLIDSVTMPKPSHSTISPLEIGSFQHIKWDREGTIEIVICTTTEGVHYCGLHELFTKVLC